MHYFQFLLIVLWLPVAFGAGLILSLLSWGNLDTNRWTARFFSIPSLRLLGLRVEVEGLEELEKHQPCIYVANHQGALDVLTFGSFFPHRTVVIAKKEIAYIPVLNLYFLAAGNVLVDRAKRISAVVSLKKAVSAMKQSRASIFIFPEGTRNRTDQIMIPLKKGAFHMAVEAQVPIVPVVSSRIGSLVNWDAGQIRKGTIRMKVLAPVSTQGLAAADTEQLAQKVRDTMIEEIQNLSQSSL